MRYTYLGGQGTRPKMVGVQCDPVRRADSCCIVSQRMATALVQLASGERHVVLRWRLRLNRKQNAKP